MLTLLKLSFCKKMIFYKKNTHKEGILSAKSNTKEFLLVFLVSVSKSL